MKSLFKELDRVETALIVGAVILGVLAAIVLINLSEPQSAIDVFSTRFDECMATEKFTRDECIVYAKGE